MKKVTKGELYADGYWLKSATLYSYDAQKRVIKTESEYEELNRYADGFRFFGYSIFVYGDGVADYEKNVGNRTLKGRAVLNAKGYFDTCFSKDDNDECGEDLSMTYSYDLTGHLLSSYSEVRHYEIEGINHVEDTCKVFSNYVWEKDDLIRTSVEDCKVKSKSNFTYGKHEVKGNLNLNALVSENVTKNHDSYLKVLECLGVRSKHLLATVSTCPYHCVPASLMRRVAL